MAAAAAPDVPKTWAVKMGITETKIIRDFPLTIDLSKALHRLGDKRPYRRIDDSLKRSLAEGKEKLFSLLRPAAIYGILDYQATNRHPIFDGAKKVALAVCTVGSDVEKESSRLFQHDDILKGLILDALASEAVKEVVWETERLIVERALGLGLWPSKRFSPGYRGWDLKEQRFVFEKIPAREIGVTLTESFMMVPRKSLSLRINFYPDRAMTTRRLPDRQGNCKIKARSMGAEGRPEAKRAELYPRIA